MAPNEVLLWRDDGSTQPFELKSTTIEQRANGVAVVAFASPKTLHSLTPQLRLEMFLVLEHCKRSPDVKVVVWTAQGDRAFSSGASLKPGDTFDMPKDAAAEYARRGMVPDLKFDNAFVRETKAFWDFPKPIIGAINGMAVGGAANIAFCYFDITLVSSKARFKYPFVDIGLTPELGSSLLLPIVMGPARAKEIIFTADWFTAQDALNWKLINHIYEPEDLLPKALELADKLAAKPNNQLILSKKILNSYLRKSLDEQLRLENQTIQASVNDFGGKEAFIALAKAKASKKSAKI